ncbi:MAG: hypothetical protein V3T13_03810, partial [Hyphomicrobium sp.]
MAKQSNLDPVEQQIEEQRVYRLIEKYFPGCTGLHDLSESELEELLTIKRTTEQPEHTPTPTSCEKKIHGNVEINAHKREQVLGAALCVLATWPDQCKRGGRINASAIARLIDEYGH